LTVIGQRLDCKMDPDQDSKAPEKIKAPFKLWGTAFGFVLLIIVIGWIGLARGCYGNDGLKPEQMPNLMEETE
jgi:hypothetical protein